MQRSDLSKRDGGLTDIGPDAHSSFSCTAVDAFLLLPSIKPPSFTNSPTNPHKQTPALILTQPTLIKQIPAAVAGPGPAAPSFPTRLVAWRTED